MKNKNLAVPVVSAIACAALFSPSAKAATVVSSSFNGVTNGAIDTSGTLDWGYLSSQQNSGFFDSNLAGGGESYNNTAFNAVANNAGDTLTTVSPSSTIGTVTLTEGTTGTDTVDGQPNTSNFTFDGSTAFGSYGNFAPGEADVWTMKFNDLGIGTFAISVYMGHSDNGRVFDMDYSLGENGTFVTGTTTSPQLSTLGSTVAAYGTSGSAFTYDIEVTTTTATEDLTLTFGGVNGGNGGAILAGYTVAVPEPSAALLGGLGALLLLRRRR